MYSFLQHVVIILICLGCYSNTLNGSFVFDDSEAIVKNADVDTNTPLQNIFLNDFWGTNITSKTSHKSYRPLTVLLYRYIVTFAGFKNPFWFHAVNLALYVFVCTELLIVLRCIFNHHSLKSKDNSAFLTTVLFASHPIHTEVVSSIVGCADLLCSLGFCLALYCYIKAVLTDSVCFYLISLSITILAMFAKEIGITVLGVCAVLDLLLGTKVGWRLTWNRKLIIRLFGLVFAGLTLLYIRYKIMNFTQPSFQPVDNPASFSGDLMTKILTYNYLYTMNVLLLLWPQWLCFDWSMNCISLLQDITDVRVVLILLFWSLSVIFIYKLLLHHDKFLLLAFTFIVIPFLPASNLLFRVGFVIAERVLFLPSIGMCLFIVFGLQKVIKIAPTWKIFINVAFWLLVILFMLKSRERSEEWLTEQTLFISALAVCPNNAKVHYNVAKVMADKGHLIIAENEYRLALKLYPQYDQAMNNLANIFRDQGRLNEAKKLLTEAISLRPEFAAAWMNLGIVLATLNEDEAAEKAYLKALSHRKSYSDCYYNVGNLYLKQKRHSEALEAWSKATSLNPSHSAAWSNRLVLLDNLGRYEEAVELSKTALTVCTTVPALHFTLANTLGKLSRWSSAEHHFYVALQLDPKNALYYSNLGVLYHRWGKLDQARQMYKKALNLNSNLNTTLHNLNKLDKIKQNNNNI